MLWSHKVYLRNLLSFVAKQLGVVPAVSFFVPDGKSLNPDEIYLLLNKTFLRLFERFPIPDGAYTFLVDKNFLLNNESPLPKQFYRLPNSKYHFPNQFYRSPNENYLVKFIGKAVNIIGRVVKLVGDTVNIIRQAECITGETGSFIREAGYALGTRDEGVIFWFCVMGWDYGGLFWGFCIFVGGVGGDVGIIMKKALYNLLKTNGEYRTKRGRG